jgi:hypothetical protein
MGEKAAAVEGAILATDTKVIQLRNQPETQEEEEFVVIDRTLFATNDTAPAIAPDSTEDPAVGLSGEMACPPLRLEPPDMELASLYQRRRHLMTRLTNP